MPPCHENIDDSQDLREQRRSQHKSQLRDRILSKTGFHALHNLQRRPVRMLHSYVICVFTYLLCHVINTHGVALACSQTHMAAKTCGNKDGSSTKVKCGSGFSENPHSTSCMNCNDNGNECCTRKLLRLFSQTVSSPPTRTPPRTTRTPCRLPRTRPRTTISSREDGPVDTARHQHRVQHRYQQRRCL